VAPAAAPISALALARNVRRKFHPASRLFSNVFRIPRSDLISTGKLSNQFTSRTDCDFTPGPNGSAPWGTVVGLEKARSREVPWRLAELGLLYGPMSRKNVEKVLEEPARRGARIYMPSHSLAQSTPV
jgi:hypothetical protein